jgi:hypothetical protein
VEGKLKLGAEQHSLVAEQFDPKGGFMSGRAMVTIARSPTSTAP